MDQVKVIFRTDKKTGEVIAWFPEIAGTRFYLQDCQTYQHVGQHGSGTFNYYYETTRNATFVLQRVLGMMRRAFQNR